MFENRAQLRTIKDADGAVVLNIRQGTISLLNETGSFIWEALQQNLTESVIVARLVEETGEPKEAVETDVREFINQLEQNKLLR